MKDWMILAPCEGKKDFSREQGVPSGQREEGTWSRGQAKTMAFWGYSGKAWPRWELLGSKLALQRLPCLFCS